MHMLGYCLQIAVDFEHRGVCYTQLHCSAYGIVLNAMHTALLKKNCRHIIGLSVIDL